MSYFIVEDIKDINESIKYLKLAAEQNFIIANYFLGFIYFMKKEPYNSIKYLLSALHYKEENKPKNNDFFNFHGNYSLPNHNLIAAYEIFTGKIVKICCFAMLIINNSDLHFNLPDNLAQFLYFEHFTLIKFLDENNLSLKYISSKQINDVNYFINCANSLNTIVMNCLAPGFLSNTIQIDINKSIHYFEISASKNDTLAQIYLAFIYLSKEYNRFNMNKAIKYLLQIAEKPKHIIYSSLYELDSFAYSNLINFDFRNELFKANQIIHEAQRNAQKYLGDIYYNGEYVSKDIDKAIHFYKLASDLDDSEASYLLGCIYHDITNKKIGNISKAIFYLNKSAKLNNANAQSYLGIIYYHGLYVQKSINKALYNFSNAGNNRLSCGFFYLGVIYYKGTDVKRDIKQSISYFIKASNLNKSYESNAFFISNTKNNLGIIYKNGDEIKKNIHDSIIYFEESIELDNNKIAGYNLAHIYFYGVDVNQDLNKAISLLLSPSIISDDFGMNLLYLVIIKKCKLLTIEEIQEEFRKYNDKIDHSNISKIYNEIIFKKLNCYAEYNELFECVKKVELFVMDIYQNVLPRLSLIENHSEKQNLNHKAKNIDSFFYDGFGNI